MMTTLSADGAFPLRLLIAGGQTGVDRAALEFALEVGIPCAGWCPAGRRSEDGPIPARFPLREASSPAYPQRTRQNVRDADATLIFTAGQPGGGTALTAAFARRLGKPCLVVDLDTTAVASAAANVLAWLQTIAPTVLNVAGPRASEAPHLPPLVRQVLARALRPAPDASPPAWPPAPPRRPRQGRLFPDGP
ncbi:MAG: hypothetical protein OZSIB_0137 [Candidatus Ozemobacter sibiricus]|jgi:hypothetical protein|uniref:Molybdenum cofactor carrier n=1 Tax=Candidatus Ozemobacter sibiricus TaxID=2268124 RepID=A0A367ZML6_9BACT|nr:MAG: hypothetical protein OZSIB_0137 [Candidatus Ozemobacter sibiricus]